jgi:hypothetical protein
MANTLLTTITTLSMVVSLQAHAQDIFYAATYAEMLAVNSAIELKYRDKCGEPDQPLLITYTSCLLRYAEPVSDYSHYSSESMLRSYRRNAEFEQRMAAEKAAREQRMAAEKAARDELAKKPGVRIGMTPDQVINETSWGRPEYINRTTTAAGVNEQWVYSLRSYLYFNNSILVSIQN